MKKGKSREAGEPCPCLGLPSKPGLPGRRWKASTSGSRCRGPRDWGAEWGAQPGTREEPARLCPRGPRGVCKRRTKSERRPGSRPDWLPGRGCGPCSGARGAAAFVPAVLVWGRGVGMMSPLNNPVNRFKFSQKEKRRCGSASFRISLPPTPA